MKALKVGQVYNYAGWLFVVVRKGDGRRVWDVVTLDDNKRFWRPGEVSWVDRGDLTNQFCREVT